MSILFIRQYADISLPGEPTFWYVISPRTDSFTCDTRAKMADLSLLQEESQEDGFCDNYIDSVDLLQQEELLSPLERLDRNLQSDNTFHKQVLVSSLLDAVRSLRGNQTDVTAVLERMVRLAQDSDTILLIELLEQLPRVVVLCNDIISWSTLLLPVLLRYLGDPNNQVRKTAQASLLVLLEQEVLKSCDLEQWVCPVLVDLSVPEANDDVKTEAMALMCQVAPLVGRGVTLSIFLPRFCQLCCDCRMFHIRKVCAANFGQMCSVVGEEATEQLLLPRFYQLCADSVWGVRKACAECFMAVSKASPPAERRNKLTQHFITLTRDPSRWVRQAAFQSLGQFISTFASSSSSSGLCSTVGEETHTRTITETTGLPLQEDSISHNALICLQSPPTEEGGQEEVNDLDCPKVTRHTHSDGQNTQPSSSSSSPTSSASSSSAPILDEEVMFNSFNFWRTPLPVLDLDLELQGESGSRQPREEVSVLGNAANSTPCCPKASAPLDLPTTSVVPPTASRQLSCIACCPSLRRSQLEDLIENLEPHTDDPDVKAQVEVLTAALRASILGVGPEEELDQSSLQCHREGQRTLGSSLDNSFSLFGEDSCCPEEDTKSQQFVVPQVLLDQYVSMVDPSRVQTVDMEITRHCAFSLPAVAMTIGPDNWSCLRHTYETLASDMQWKVRRTLAFSLHELAVILGAELTAEDLLPMFNSFLKDLDEVRIGVLKHLYDFLRLLQVDVRRKYLQQLQEFLVTDNSRNWRFRAELAHQLVLLLDLYSSQEVFDVFVPLSFSLMTDRVSAVRQTAYRLVAGVMRKLSHRHTLLTDFLSCLVAKLGHAHKWSHRQTYTTVCQLVLEEECVSLETFSAFLLVPLLRLTDDPVANVRVLLAKALKHTLLEREYFLSVHQVELQAALSALQADLDRDVQYYATHAHIQLSGLKPADLSGLRT